MKRLRVGVFMGGKSAEKEVSFNSGRTVCDHLDTQRFEVIPIFQSPNGLLYLLPWRFLHRGKISDFLNRLPYEAKQIEWQELKNIVDFIYLAVHGRYAEDGTLQGMLEIMKVPYLGTKVFGSALVMDKIVSNDFLKSNNISVPKSVVVHPQEIKNFDLYLELIEKKLEEQNISLPYVVKPHKEGSSIGISVVENKEDLLPALKKACFTNETKHQSVIIEEKIKGMEFTCIVLIDNTTEQPIALPPTEIISEEGSLFFDYEQKYMPGRAIKITPARCSKEQIDKIHETCIKVMKTLEIKTIARIDGFLTEDDQIIIIDSNTVSGMTPASFIFRQAAEIGLSHTQLINHLIEADLKYYGLSAHLTNKNVKDQTMNNENKVRVAVLMGGNSNEKEISLESGRNICYKLSPEKYQFIPIFVDNNMDLYAISQKLLVRSCTKEIQFALEPNMKLQWSDLPKISDFVFIGLHGGQGENGCVQGALEMLDMPYNGSSVFASSLCMDKYKTAQFLKFKGFDVPENILISKSEWQENQEKVITQINSKLNFPFILKPHNDGCSVMVQKVNNLEDLQNGIQNIFNNGKEFALAEEYIIGMELTVGVIGNNHPIALPASQAVASKGILSIEEKFLPGEGENQTPAPISKDIMQLTKKTIESAYKAIGCKGYARIDCFYQNEQQSPTGKDRIVILEFNTLPGVTPATCIFHQAAEMDIKPMDFIDLIITLGFEEHKSNNLSSEHKESVNKIIEKLNLPEKYSIKEL